MAPKDMLEAAPTFELERWIMEACFKEIWDSLNVDQRKDLIQQINTKHKLKSIELANMTGTGALALLNASVYSSGFAFYTTMSTVICGAAGFLGVTLPFSVYVGASTTVSVLSGPVGWVLLAIGTIGNLALLGKANWKKTMAFIINMHCLKVDLLR